MRFMNEWDIQRADRLYRDHAVLGPAVETIANLKTWADQNSDGWCYWPKPARAAASLMELIEGNGTNQAQQEADQRATVEAYRKALRPIKAFRTRQHADFTIVEPRT
jgi:hypothetical protein